MALTEKKSKKEKSNLDIGALVKNTETPSVSKKTQSSSFLDQLKKASMFSKKPDAMAKLDQAVSQIEKTFGKGTLMKLDSSTRTIIPVVPTGSLGVDLALGVGGIPQGRIVEIYGPESSGKTTLTLHIAAQCQAAGGRVAFIDAEHALDIEYARRIGVDVDNTLISQPDNGEQALEVTNMLVDSGAVDLVIIDSVAALTPKAEIEGEMGDSHMGLQARLMSQALRKLTASVSRNKCTVIFINQLRKKIGVMFGNPETTTGGESLKFYASVRLDVRKTQVLKDGENAIGQISKVKVIKNKVSAPFKEANVEIFYGLGFSPSGDLVDVASNLGILHKAGAWFSYNNEKVGQGREQAKKFMESNPLIAEEIKAKIYEKHFNSENAAPDTAIERNNELENQVSEETGTDAGEEKTEEAVQ